MSRETLGISVIPERDWRRWIWSNAEVHVCSRCFCVVAGFVADDLSVLAQELSTIEAKLQTLGGLPPRTYDASMNCMLCMNILSHWTETLFAPPTPAESTETSDGLTLAGVLASPQPLLRFPYVVEFEKYRISIQDPLCMSIRRRFVQLYIADGIRAHQLVGPDVEALVGRLDVKNVVRFGILPYVLANVVPSWKNRKLVMFPEGLMELRLDFTGEFSEACCRCYCEDVGLTFRKKKNRRRRFIEKSSRMDDDIKVPIGRDRTVNIIHVNREDVKQSCMQCKDLALLKKCLTATETATEDGRTQIVPGTGSMETIVRISVPQCVVNFYRPLYYLVGRYAKYERGVPQTVWNNRNESEETNGDDGEIEQNGENGGVQSAMPEDSSENQMSAGWIVQKSVEEFVAPYARLAVPCEFVTFHAAGREDIDVRMLGEGRPFYVAYTNAINEHSLIPMAEMEKRINDDAKGSVIVRGLHMTFDSKYVEQFVKEAAENKKKVYRCVVWSKYPLAKDLIDALNAHDLQRYASLSPFLDKDSGALSIEQWTPMRVIHRRPNMLRKRLVYWIDVEPVAGTNGHWYVIRLCTQAGAYVKEFIHGDRGRTHPSFVTLTAPSNSGVIPEVDILQLDVDDLDLSTPEQMDTA